MVDAAIAGSVVVAVAVAYTRSLTGVAEATTKIFCPKLGPVFSAKLRVYVPVAIEFQVTDGHDHAVIAACPEASTRPSRFAPGTTAAQAVVCALLGPTIYGVI